MLKKSNLAGGAKGNFLFEMEDFEKRQVTINRQRGTTRA